VRDQPAALSGAGGLFASGVVRYDAPGPDSKNHRDEPPPGNEDRPDAGETYATIPALRTCHCRRLAL